MDQPITCGTQVPTRHDPLQEAVNSITHGVGLLLSIAGLIALAALVKVRGDFWQKLGCGIYGASLVVLYSASTLYHGFQTPRVKDILRIVDHSCVYLLIAGSYTPFTLTLLRNRGGWILLGLVWSLAAVGIACKMAMLGQVALLERFDTISTWAYLVMGWLVLLVAKPAFELIPTGGLALLGAGGLSYTVGVAFYAKDTIPFFHAIWHLFVLIGSAFHFFAVMFYVLPG